ncbi:MAG: GNAT family N-acetyltransferase [Spirochaetales bacterium]|nr:GNAT family N-acetyltransferase [Spirochaetales bacterium]
MIRKYIEGDLDQCMELWRDFDRVHLEASSYFFRQPSEEEMFARHNKYAASKDSLIVVSDEGHLLSGFIAGVFRMTPQVNLLRDRKILDIHALSVLPGYQDRKTALGLFDFIFNLAKKEGVLDVEGSIWAFNEKAMSFVEKIGFKVQSRKYGYHLEGKGLE